LQEDELRIKNVGQKGYRRGDSLIKSGVLYRGYRKDERGSSKYGEDFNDREYIADKRVKINQVNVWFNEGKVVGIQGIYKTIVGEKIEGGQHCIKPDQSKLQEIKMTEDDYLKEISGFLGGKEEYIECLILTSFKGEVYKIGQPSGTGKNFKLDINELEFPACFYGTIRGILSDFC
jgi:hypothetical protein